MAKKMSAYAKHCKSEMKKGKSMSEAAASWNHKKTGGKKKKGWFW